MMIVLAKSTPAERLAILMVIKGMTIGKLSEKTGLNKNSLFRLMRDLRRGGTLETCRKSTIISISMALGVTPDVLLVGGDLASQAILDAVVR